MKVADLEGVALDYWVARSLHDFVREIYFTDSGETVAIRGNDHGRPWDGRFTPSSSWETAAVVLERAQRFEVREPAHRGAAHCVAEFEGGNGTVEGRGESLRVALLRAFVESRFGDSVEDILRQSQSLIGARAQSIGEETVFSSYADVPTPDGEIGDIQAQPR
ncbi:phage protein NinX family protein [Paraburkholderia sp. PREW-6R]|uniref:phage protein NinX family protein n=1 Tax=Paraburkholderia sp. PREW-6R TaxID=3141544 RepID=UPI0031F5B855